MERMSAIASFDVFDTVLTRRVGAPNSVVEILARRLEREKSIPVSASGFAASRRRQEKTLKQLLGRHPGLREIYQRVAAGFSVDISLSEEWATAEEDVERELVVAVPGAHRMLSEARAAGDRVVFISDTPHTEKFVTELLVTHELASPQEHVFTSSERGVSKSSGGLFDLVRDLVEMAPSYRHVGDNETSDLAAALAEGWDGRVAPGGRLTKYERVLESYSAETSLFTSWLAGASRVARLEAREQGVPKPLADVATGALAPLLVGYSLWVVAQARLRGIKRLYFVARDGRVMLDVARHMIGHLAPDLELRYLYGSRQAWTLGASAYSEEVLKHWTWLKSEHTARSALARFKLTPEQVHGCSPFPFTAPGQVDRLLTAQERSTLTERLQQEPLVSLVRAEAQRAADLAMEYLRQEGLCDGVPTALVDAGWGGRAASAFDVLVEAAGGTQATHLVMGITGSAADARARAGVDLVPWLFDEQTYPGSVRLRAPHVLVEMFCADITGRTMGYQRTEEGVVPVLQVDRNEPVIAWGLRPLQDIAVRVSELVTPQATSTTANLDCSGFVTDVLRAFWVTPSPAEVKSWGSFPWEEDLATPFQPIARPITSLSVATRLARGERRLRPGNAWRAGTARISPQPWRGLLTWRAWREDNRATLNRWSRRLRLGVVKRRPTLRVRRSRGR